MKRNQPFISSQCYQLDLPVEELVVLLGDDDGLLWSLGFGTMQCTHCGISPEKFQDCDVFLDADCCLFLVSSCHYCSEGPVYTFIDTTDLPEWQYILRHLLQQQMGLNSWGDE